MRPVNRRACWPCVIAAMLLLPLVVWLGGWRFAAWPLLAGYMLMGLMYTRCSRKGYFNALLYASSGLCGMLLYVYPDAEPFLRWRLGWEKLDSACWCWRWRLPAMAITLGGKLGGQPIGVPWH
jgi:hypothetical protein